MKNIKLLTLFLIFVIATSPTMFIDGKVFAIDLKQQTISENKVMIEQKDVLQKPKHHFITLTESLSIHTNDERKTIMERIFDRTKLNRIVFDSTIYSVEDDLTLGSLANEPQSETSYSDLELQIDQRLPTLLIDFSVSEEQLELIYKDIDEFSDQLITTTSSLFDVNNPMFLLVLPLAGFVLIRIENEKLDFNSLKRVFCFVFVTILILSAVITPMSISSAYWGVAYAEEFPIDNQTSSNSIPANSTASISVEQVNATPIEPVDSLEAIVIENFQNLGGSTPEPVEPVINAASYQCNFSRASQYYIS